MDPRLNEQEEQLRSRAAAATNEALADVAAAIDHNVAASREALTALGGAGLLGVAVSEEFGGGGAGPTGLVLCVEEIGRMSASVGAVAVNHMAVMSMIAAAGTDEQKAAWLPPLASGQQLAAFGVDEARSILNDPAATATLHADGEESVLEGTVSGVFGATIADVFLVATTSGGGDSDAADSSAASSPAADSRAVDSGAADPGVALFLVNSASEGVRIGVEEAKLGLNGSGVSDLSLTKVGVQPGQRIDGGDAVLAGGLDMARLGFAALCVGIAQAALDLSTRHITASKDLADSQSVQWMIADSATESEAARLTTWYASTRSGDELTEAAAMARLLAADAAVKGTRRTLQVYGSAGSARAAGVERLYRDAKAMEVHQGSSDAQRLAIARQLLPDLVDG